MLRVHINHRIANHRYFSHVNPDNRTFGSVGHLAVCALGVMEE